MSEEDGRVEIESRYLCDERSSDGAVLTLTAGPERADEGGGPTSGRLGQEQRVEKSQLARPHVALRAWR
jgi:hypothetical protein